MSRGDEWVPCVSNTEYEGYLFTVLTVKNSRARLSTARPEGDGCDDEVGGSVSMYRPRSISVEVGCRENGKR